MELNNVSEEVSKLRDVGKRIETLIRANSHTSFGLHAAVIDYYSLEQEC